MDDKLTIRETASYLGVSTATVKNWQRAGLLTSLDKKNLIDFSTKRNMEGRLTQRANKRVSQQVFSPREYDIPLNAALEQLITKEGWTREEALLFGIEDLIFHSGSSPENIYFQREMKEWRKKLPRRITKKNQTRPKYPKNICSMNDFPGWLYQSLQREGSKSLKGSYFTPPSLVDGILEDLNEITPSDKTSFYDPCCGTGIFLCRAALKLGSPLLIFGQDIDPLAVRLARINLMLLYPRLEFEPQVFPGDSLLSPHVRLKNKKFDFIATNPPWGYRFSPDQKKKITRCYALKSLESSSCFILSSLEHLKRSGKAGLLLPESLLHRERHRDIRRLLENRVEKIVWQGKIFTRVQSECFTLILKKTCHNKPHDISISQSGRNYTWQTGDLSDNPLGIWNIFTSPAEKKIFQKMFVPDHITLKNHARWGLGIVTGDNKKYLKEGTEPILTGQDVTPFKLRTPEKRLNYHDNRLQQKAPLELYRSAKILYRFIAKRPITSLDETGYLTLNSLNFFIPDSSIDRKILIMLFNSSLYALYFEKTFHTLKVLRSHLESLPIPKLTEKEKEIMKSLYSGLVEGDERAIKKGNNFIYNLFNITEEERIILESNI